MSNSRKRLKLDQLIENLKTAKETPAKETTTATSTHIAPGQLSAPPPAVIGGCRVCNLSFGTEREILVHVMGHYPKLIYLTGQSISAGQMQSRYTEAEPVTFNSDHQLAVVRGTEGTSAIDRDQHNSLGDLPQVVCSIGSGQSTASHSVQHHHTSSPPTDLPYFMCPQCSQTFADRAAYSMHMDAHANQRMWKVNRSQLEAFLAMQLMSTTPGRRQTEERDTSRMPNSLPCEICGEILPSTNELVLHHERAHECSLEDTQLKRSESNSSLTLNVVNASPVKREAPSPYINSSPEGDHRQALLSMTPTKTVDMADSATPTSKSIRARSVTPVSFESPADHHLPRQVGRLQPLSVSTGQSPACTSTLTPTSKQVDPTQNEYLSNLLDDICPRQERKRKSLRANVDGQLVINSSPGAAADTVEPPTMVTATGSSSGTGGASTPRSSKRGILRDGSAQKTSSASALVMSRSQTQNKTADDDGLGPLQNDYLNSLLEKNVRKQNKDGKYCIMHS